MTDARGVSVLEWVALVALVGVVIALFTAGGDDLSGQARMRLESLSKAVRDYHTTTGTWPDPGRRGTLWFHQLKSLEPRPPHYIQHLPLDYFDYEPTEPGGRVFDPWGRAVAYDRIDGGFTLTSRGPDPETPRDDIVVTEPR